MQIGFPQPKKKWLGTKLINIVANLHAHHIAHGDLKEDNILLDENFSLLLIDFERTLLTSETYGTLVYYSPESIFSLISPFQVRLDPFQQDVWALGLILYRLFEGIYPPFFYSLEKVVGEENPDILLEAYLQILPQMAKLPPIFYQSPYSKIIGNMLSYTALKRLTMEQVKEAWENIN